jgi:5-methylcytosine-specific restriction endonuclease McrA
VTSAVLLLNSSMLPLKVIPWERAVMLVLDNKADIIVGYANRFIRSASTAMEWPAVVALRRFCHIESKLRFSRSNLLARDSYQCQYCGVRPTKNNGSPNLEDLTIDHVVPRAQSVKGKVKLPWNGKTVAITTWENTATACRDCNARKADRTPDQAKMPLLKIPKKPSAMDAIKLTITKYRIPEEWQDYLGDSPWGDYWDGELDPS